MKIRNFSNYLKTYFTGFLVFGTCAINPSFGDQTFTLSEGSIEYKVDHLLKTTHGQSKSIKGKIVCVKPNQDCDFLFAVPTASFDSKNSNRDAHMKATIKEANFPLATVSGHIRDLIHPEKNQAITVDFAGKKVNYPLTELTWQAGKRYALHAQFALKLTSHEIELPSLLGASISDSVPIQVQLVLDSTL